MPLTTDEKILALAQDLLKEFEILFGSHPGFRPTHAKGTLLTGTFTPTPAASSLTRAPHMNRPSTPVTVRYSDTTGIPMIPDTDPNASPRGCAIRFHLAERVHTDIIAHSVNAFPTRTAQELLEFFRALAATDLSKLPGSPLEAFLGSHPAALAFVQAPKPVPSSFGREAFFGITAMRFSNKDGQSRYGRYRIVPEAGVDYLSETAAAAKSANFLFDEIDASIAKVPIKLRIVAQLANDGDIVNDATKQWPDGRTLLDLGTIALTAKVPNDAHEQQHTIFDPLPRVDGIEPSDDPLLEVRAAVYLMSGRRRRAAEGASTAKSGA